MTWTKLGDDFTDRPGIIGLSDAAFRAHIEALVAANQQTTDGRLPGGLRELRRILSIEDLAATVTELTKAGLWEAVDEDYQLDWSEHESAERVRDRKAFNAERQRKFFLWPSRKRRPDCDGLSWGMERAQVRRTLEHWTPDSAREPNGWPFSARRAGCANTPGNRHPSWSTVGRCGPTRS